jgi:hypothetical protein
VPTEETKAFCYGRILYVAARLTQAASIPEDLTDNELDEVLNAKTSFNKVTDLQNTADKWVTRFETDQRVIVSVADLLQDRLENITYKPGHGSRTITSDTSRVYSTVLFRLLELIIMDVIAGHVVYFDRNVKSMFYVDYKPASQEIISGKGIKRT